VLAFTTTPAWHISSDAVSGRRPPHHIKQPNGEIRRIAQCGTGENASFFAQLSIVRIANVRVKKHETDRLNWRKGALGEYEVGAELERLPDDYLVFNDVSTQEFGNFDHIVIGPKGIFAIETKNWTGLIGTTADGEITRNGKPFWRSYIRMLERKVMMLREQIVVLTRRDDLFIRGLMVFPKAYIEAGGKTRNIHCLTVERVYDYFDKCPKRLQPNEIERIARAVKSIADINSEGPTRPEVRGRRSEVRGPPAESFPTSDL
jgi:hypothetical protein